MQLLKKGDAGRVFRATRMNQHSSRSHSVFQITVERVGGDGPEDAGTVVRSQLNLVDLAGSEKWDVAHSETMNSDHIAELTNINLSLHTLGRCIASLSKGGASLRHVPFRESKLTRLLSNSLGGTARTRIVATLSPSMLSAEESISTLKVKLVLARGGGARTLGHEVMGWQRVNKLLGGWFDQRYCCADPYDTPPNTANTRKHTHTLVPLPFYFCPPQPHRPIYNMPTCYRYPTTPHNLVHNNL